MSYDKTQFTAARADGWPFCPSCGADKLFAVDETDVEIQPVVITPETTKLAHEGFLTDGVACFHCGWLSKEALAKGYRQPGMHEYIHVTTPEENAKKLAESDSVPEGDGNHHVVNVRLDNDVSRRLLSLRSMASAMHAMAGTLERMADQIEKEN